MKMLLSRFVLARFLFALLACAAVASPAFAFNVKPLNMGSKNGGGQEVWFAEDHTLPMIAVTAALPAGSAYDPHDKSGLAVMAASLIDQGAGNLDARAFQNELSIRAIRFSANPERDYLVISLITLKANAKDAFRLLAMALTQPRFDADAINRTRAQLIQSVQQGQEDPETVASRAFFRAYFGNHPYGNPTRGEMAGLAKISAADLRAFARRNWVKAGAKIAVAGDIDQKTLLAYLNDSFGKLPNVAPPPVPPVQRNAAGWQRNVSMKVPQPVAVFGLPGLLRNDKDFLAAYLANHIMGGGGFSSRLMREIREKRGLTYGVSSNLSTYRRTGLLAGSVATKREAMGQTITVLRETLKKFADEGPSAVELADAKTYLTGSYPLAFSSNAGIAAQLSAFQRAGLPVDYVGKRNSLIQAVTIGDVKRVAKRLFDPQKLVILVAGDMDKPKAPTAPAR